MKKETQSTLAISAILSVISIIVFFLLTACEPEKVYNYPCPDGNCNMHFYVDTIVSPGSYTDINGYTRVKFRGLNYFTIQGYLEELHPDYVVNKVPLIETQYDTDYWVVFDTLQWTIPMYSYMSWFSDRQFEVPFPVGSRTYTLKEISQLHPPLNIAGYQIPKRMCWDCPYTPTLLGTYSKYNYAPRQQFLLDNEMVGDTAQLFIRVLFNNDSGFRITKDTTINVIFE